MPRLEQIQERLPSLYRPQPGDTSLLTKYLRAVADCLEEINREATDVLHAHWFRFADRATFNPYFNRDRQLQELPPAGNNSPDISTFPYIDDLGHLAALLSLSPWQQPPALREFVETYRQRVSRTVALYKNGLGTVDALRRMIEAQLPIEQNPDTPLEERDRPFWLEEFSPLVTRVQPIVARGAPTDKVGPLMRWQITNDGLAPALPTVFIKGLEPVDNEIDATENPILEIFNKNNGRPPLGIAYEGTIKPEETLRLRPAYNSWIGLEKGISRARSRPSDTTQADPTAPGPWNPMAGDSPKTNVRALHHAYDKTLWVACDDEGTGTLWRFDGQEWTEALTDLPTPLCLAEEREHLLVGTEEGLFRVDLYPEENDSFTAQPIEALDDHSIFALHRSGNEWWLGTSLGIFRLGANDEISPNALGEEENAEMNVFAIFQERNGTFFFGTERGLVYHQPSTNEWYWFLGGNSTENESDWRIFIPGSTDEQRSIPEEDDLFLPPVHAIHRGPDASLWLGTEQGIARYIARSVRGLTYETVLEAFPDLSQGQVFAIEEDARGLVWFCTDRGLVRYDGHDWWQPRSTGWKHLGAAGTLFGDQPTLRGSWLFNRSTLTWERLINGAGRPFEEKLRTILRPEVHAILWTDSLEADRGNWNGQEFIRDSGVSLASFRMRVKPQHTVILDGGLPAIPRLPQGNSHWRYLSLEPSPVPDPEPKTLPAWTIEGRLLPPPDDRATPGEGRFDVHTPAPSSDFDEAVFPFNPAAQVWFEWDAKRALTVLARLGTRTENERIDPAILDRVWQGIQQVRPAGVRTLLAVDEHIVRGG